MSVAFYLAGYVILIAGLALGVSYLQPMQWLIVVGVLLVGGLAAFVVSQRLRGNPRS